MVKPAWLRLATLGVLWFGLAASVFASDSNLTWQASLTLKEAYDDNVFILNTEPDPAIVPPPDSIIAVPKKGSLVTSVTPSMGLTYRVCPAFAASISYAPEMTWYHATPSEDYVAHRGAINFNGKIEDATYEWLNSICWIDGNDRAVTTIRPGDCRAIGGIPLRDRRDAAIYRDGFKLAIPIGKWMVRPVVNTYVHDFQTEQRANTNLTQYLYENYIDRWDVGGGLDVGYEVRDKTRVLAGYRYGHQEQGEAVGVPSQYNNHYQRFLLGLEGTPVPWLKLAVLAGPDLRDWPDLQSANTNFNRDEILWYVDASVTVIPSKSDSLTLKITRFEQPAFTSQSVYEDIKYDLSWRRRFTDKFTAGVGFQLYIGDWQAPMHREDWIYTPSATASYAFNKHVLAELNYSYDTVINQVPTTAPGATYANGREYTRNLVSLAVRYTF